GGAPDDWRWPRHCGDFSYMRVYSAPDGTPARFDKKNIPYKPESWLRVTASGVKKNDLTFIMGFPGRTNRQRTSYSARYHQDIMLPGQIAGFQRMVDRIKEMSEESESAAIENLSRLKGVQNGLKNFMGKVEWMKKKGLVAELVAEEEAFQKRIQADPRLAKRYGRIFETLADIYDKIEYR
ncbi:MAG: S46 family peptidase, partial [bacterium]|nr:S46 family peptidase [bacterium]